MFDRFESSFRASPVCSPREMWRDERLSAVAGYEELLLRFAGCSFENGLYRLHDAESGPAGEDVIADAFPEFVGRACPFGYDWLGRQFAVDALRTEGTEPLVLLMEPGTGEALEIPLTFAAFHAQLGDLREPALAASFFEQWSDANPGLIPIGPSDCVGYRVPLFLGGTDTVDNLEVIDLAVYWSLSGQLRQGTLTLPAGKSIREVRIVD